MVCGHAFQSYKQCLQFFRLNQEVTLDATMLGQFHLTVETILLEKEELAVIKLRVVRPILVIVSQISYNAFFTRFLAIAKAINLEMTLEERVHFFGKLLNVARFRW